MIFYPLLKFETLSLGENIIQIYDTICPIPRGMIKFTFSIFGPDDFSGGNIPVADFFKINGLNQLVNVKSSFDRPYSKAHKTVHHVQETVHQAMPIF